MEKGSEILARARKARPETTNGPGTALRGCGAAGRPPGPSQPRRGAAGGEARGAPSATGAPPAAAAPRGAAGTLPEPLCSADSGANPPLLRVAPVGLTERGAEPRHPRPLRALPPVTYIQAVEAGVHAPSHAELSSGSRPGGTRPFISSPPPRGQPPPGSSPTGGTGARPRAALCPPGGGWRGAQPSGGAVRIGERPPSGVPGSRAPLTAPGVGVGVGVGRQGRSCRCPAASRGWGAAGAEETMG